MLPKDPQKALLHRKNLSLARLRTLAKDPQAALESCERARKGRTGRKPTWSQESRNKAATIMSATAARDLSAGKKWGGGGNNRGVPQEKNIIEKRRYGQLKAIQEGRWNPQDRGVTTHLETTKAGKVFCRSSWEKIYVEYLEKNPNVVSFAKDKIRIPYLLRGITRVYIADFLVSYSSGEVLVEIKPLSFLRREETIAKFEAAKLWCNNRNIPFMIISEPQISEINGGRL